MAMHITNIRNKDPEMKFRHAVTNILFKCNASVIFERIWYYYSGGKVNCTNQRSGTHF